MNTKQEVSVVDDEVVITPMEMIKIAVEGGADLQQMQQLMDLQERWEGNQARKAFVRALAAFKANPPTVIKQKKASYAGRSGGAQTSYEYATLAQVADVITPALSAHGLSHRWSVHQDETGIAVTCVLTHEDGHSEAVTMKAPADTTGSKNSIQAIGSTTTYLQRYTLLACTGLAAGDADDDGHRAVDTPMISEEQKTALIEKQKQVAPESTKGFLRALGVETLELLPAARYDEAMRRLDEKARAAS